MSDERNPDLIEHTLRTLAGQRVFALAHVYDDINDYEQLRHEPAMGALLSKLSARRRRANAGKRIVGQFRERWPKTLVILRADSGFCREALMRLREENGVGYVFGLVRALGAELQATAADSAPGPALP